MMTLIEDANQVKFCFAVLGGMNPSLKNQIHRLGVTPTDIHIIQFVEADSRQEWIQWKVRTKELEPGIGIGAGAAGCAIGHIEAWRTLQNCDHEFLIVLEDDAQFTKYGEKYFKFIINQLSGSRLRLIHLGDHIKFNTQHLLSCIVRLQLREIFRLLVERKLLVFFKPKFALNQFPFSGHAYVIDREIAKIAITEGNSFLFPIDVFLNSISQVPRNLTARIRTPLIVQSNLRESQIKIRGR
jgi:GR25 family glycosyltransferase involved in LPS biosynthesis